MNTCFHRFLRLTIGAALCLVATVAWAQAPPALPADPSRSVVIGPAVVTFATPISPLTVPRTTTTTYTLTYSTRDTGRNLTLDVTAFDADFWDHGELVFEVSNIQTVQSFGTSSSPGAYVGQQRVTSDGGPISLMLGINQVEASLTITLTYRTTSRYALAGEKQFSVTYTLE